MSDAIAMFRRCYEHQHPEDFGRRAVEPEYPRETWRSDEIATGFNREGTVPEERPCETGP